MISRRIIALSAASVSKMFNGNNLQRYLGGSIIMNPSSGGVALQQQSYFQNQHYRLHHKNELRVGGGGVSRGIHCTCQISRGSSSVDTSKGDGGGNGMNNGSGNNSHNHHVDPELQAKLEEWKNKLATNAYYEKYKEKFQKLELYVA
jgi:hypothetical protein